MPAGAAPALTIHAMARFEPAARLLTVLGDDGVAAAREIADPVKESGVPRPRAAALASIYAGLVAGALRTAEPEPHPTGAILLTASSTLDVCSRFEATGLEEGWDLVDPFALPNAIPSAAATHVSRILDADRGALVLPGGAVSLPLALDSARLLLEGDVRRVAVIATEHRLQSIHCSNQTDGRIGAVGFLLGLGPGGLPLGGALIDAIERASVPGECEGEVLASSVAPLLALFDSLLALAKHELAACA